MKRIALALLIVCIMAAPGLASTDITLPNLPSFDQQAFKDLSRDLGLAISYTPLSPAEPLGGVLPGFDAGVEVTAVQIDTNKQYWQDIKTASGTIPGTLPFPKVHIQVGLPFIPIDLGYVMSSVPGTNIKYMGGEIKYAILKGGVVMPALAVRGAYTKLSGVEDLDINTKSLDISISKGFLMFTPYAGYGMVQINSKENSALVAFTDEKITENKAFVGLKFSLLPILNVVAEADFAAVKAYSLRLNVHF